MRRGASPSEGRTLRARLLLALLALALIPTAVFTVFTLSQLNQSIDRWYRPGVARALEAGLEIGKSSLTRFESLLMSQAEAWAARWTGSLDKPTRAAWSAALAGTGIDFLQVYRRDQAGHWRLIDQVVPRGVLAATPLDLGDDVGPALAAGQTLRSERGALAGVGGARNGDAVVAGIAVHPEFFAEVRNLGEGAVHYRQLGLYVDLERRVYMILVGALMLLLAGAAWFVSQAIARQTARPIQTLAEAIERVASGDLGVRVAPSGAAELRLLGASFNAMAGRLSAARDALQQAEREAVWRDVARKLAHEFKNILTPMQLSLQLVEARMDSVPVTERESFRRSLDSALREVDHLNRLAEQFSQYARLPEPHFEVVDLGEIVRAVVQAGTATAGKVVVRAEVPAFVRGDRLLLSRAIHNLVLNAREACPSGSPVEIEVADRNGAVVVEVLDRGSGIPADLQPRLFEPYVSTKRRGSGLGLSLVRDIVRQHGGSVTLENRDGGGARARLKLPHADAAARRGAAPDAAPRA